jgi:tetratricopeptide (TPR) repeat protein
MTQPEPTRRQAAEEQPTSTADASTTGAKTAASFDRDTAYYTEVRESVGHGTITLLLGTSTRSLERGLTKVRSAHRAKLKQPLADDSPTAGRQYRFRPVGDPKEPTPYEIGAALTPSPLPPSSDPSSPGTALNNLGLALQEMRRFDEAVSAIREAAAIFRETGDRDGRGTALTSLGMTLRKAGRFEEAISAHQEAAAMFRETGDRDGLGVALNNLGVALRGVQRFEEAISAHQEAAAMFREAGDRQGEGIALQNLEFARGAHTAESRQ